MIVSLTGPAWAEVTISGDTQITNQGRTKVRIAQSDVAPTDDNSGEILSTYDQSYASCIVTGSDPVWLLSIGGAGLVSVQGV